MSKRLFIRKPIMGKFDDGGEGEHRLKRHLGPFHLVAIGIGAIIGAGIFVISGQAAALYAGPGIVLSFIIASLICLFAGLCYAELAALIPVSGGSYSYAYVALGELPAWIVGWTLIVQYLVSSSTVAVGWSAYFSSLLSDFGIVLSNSYTQAPLNYLAGQGWSFSGSLFNLPAGLLVILIILFISIGIKAATRFNNFMVVIKVSTIILFIVLGFSFIKTSNLTPFIPENTGHFGSFGWSGVLRGAGLVFFAYIGFDSVCTLAQESKNPQRDLPIGILGSLAISTIFYIITALILTGVVSYTLLNVSDPMSVALNAMGSKFDWLKFVVKFAILAGLASVVLVQLMGQTRVFFAMSQDGLLPKRFSKIHSKFNTPFFATMITGLVAFFIAGLFPVNVLGELVSIATLFLFAIVCLGVMILRYLHPEFERPFKVPFVPLVPILGILACVSQMCFLPLLTWFQLIGWLAVGFLIYFCYGVRHSKIRTKGIYNKEL